MNTLEQNNSKIVMNASGDDSTSHVILCLMALMVGAGIPAISSAEQPAVDNERVVVSDVHGPQPPAQYDFVAVSLSHLGTAEFGRQGATPGAAGAHTILIELKDHPVEPLANSTPYPLAFPRRHAKKLFENDRVVVWQFRWHPGEPTPMHFHDKDAVVVFESVGAVKSTTKEGESSVGEFKFGNVRFNPRGRIHTEILASGNVQAVITELK